MGRTTPFALQSFLLVEVILQNFKVRNTEWGCEPGYIKDRLQRDKGRSHNSKERYCPLLSLVWQIANPHMLGIFFVTTAVEYNFEVWLCDGVGFILISPAHIRAENK